MPPDIHYKSEAFGPGRTMIITRGPHLGCEAMIEGLKLWEDTSGRFPRTRVKLYVSLPEGKRFLAPGHALKPTQPLDHDSMQVVLPTGITIDLCARFEVEDDVVVTVGPHEGQNATVDGLLTSWDDDDGNRYPEHGYRLRIRGSKDRFQVPWNGVTEAMTEGS